MAHGVAVDDAAGRHHGLGRAQAALAVLVVDQRQDAGIGVGGRGAPAGAVVRQHRLDQIGQQRARHGAGGAGVEVGHQGDGFLAVERPFDRGAAGLDQAAQLGRGAGHLDLEIAHAGDLVRQAHEEGNR